MCASHRQVLVWLFDDRVHWLIQTNQLPPLRPRRNSQSSISAQVDHLVTGDKHGIAVKEYSGVKVVTASAFYERLIEAGESGGSRS